MRDTELEIDTSPISVFKSFMWSRKLSASMGIDQTDFARAFISALNDESVIKKLDDTIGAQLHFELKNIKEANKKLKDDLSAEFHKEVESLRNIITEKDAKINELEQKVSSLEVKLDDYEQYSRRNSLRITGIKETDSENVEDKVLNLLNDKLELETPITVNHVDRIHRVGAKVSSTKTGSYKVHHLQSQEFSFSQQKKNKYQNTRRQT